MIHFSFNASVNPTSPCFSSYSLEHSLAYFLFACECAQTGVLTAGAYYQVVYHSGDAETMEELYHPWCGLMVTCAIASIIVQGFFAWRIYRLSRIRVLVGGIVIVSSCGAIMCLLASSLCLVSQMSFAQGACAIVSGFTVRSRINRKPVRWLMSLSML